MTHNDRHERFEKLRRAGFDTETARNARGSELRTNALLRRRSSGETPEKAKETVETRSSEQLRAEAVVESPTAKRLRGADQETRDANWSRWSGEGFPRTITRIAEAFRQEFLRQGKTTDEIEPRLWGLVWEWYNGHFDYDDIVADTDIFDEY